VRLAHATGIINNAHKPVSIATAALGFRRCVTTRTRYGHGGVFTRAGEDFPLDFFQSLHSVSTCQRVRHLSSSFIMHSFKTLPFQVLILAPVLMERASADCYYPDGSNATDYTYEPCKSGTGFSSCCIPGEGDLCLSDGLCYYSSGSYPFRGACTDPTFKSKECPQYCTGSMLSSFFVKSPVANDFELQVAWTSGWL
jgi:hypothetical protein